MWNIFRCYVRTNPMESWLYRLVLWKLRKSSNIASKIHLSLWRIKLQTCEHGYVCASINFHKLRNCPVIHNHGNYIVEYPKFVDIPSSCRQYSCAVFACLCCCNHSKSKKLFSTVNSLNWIVSARKCLSNILQTCLQFVYSTAVKVMCFPGIVRPKTFQLLGCCNLWVLINAYEN